jgi:hypothetical protein
VKDFWGKLSKILLFCLVLLIPTQLGKHFWFNWSSVLGIRVDYFSPTVYLIDLVFLVWMIINCLGQNKRKIRFNFSLLLVLIFIGLNVLVSVNKWLAFYKWIRLGELVYFGFWVFKNKKVVGNVYSLLGNSRIVFGFGTNIKRW